MLITEREPLRIWVGQGVLLDEPTHEHVPSVAAFDPKENDKLSLRIDLLVVELLLCQVPLIGSARAIKAGSTGMWCECNIGIKPEADALNSGDLRWLLAGAIGGRAQIAA